jgi:serine palmitoyltransferase
VYHTESQADGKTAASKLFLQLGMVQLPSHSSPPFVTSLDKVREIMSISRAQTRSYLKERRKPHKALSSKGQFACNLVEPYLNWFGKNNRILLTQCLGRVKVEEWNGTSSTIVNGSSHNYAGFYKATDESEELQRLCLEKLPFADPKATPLLQAATHTALSRFFGADFCYTCSTGYGANYIALPALVDSTYLVLLDEEVHNSMLTGTYLAQARCVKKFAHNDMEQLETILAELGDSFDNVLIAVEGFYR